MSRQIIEQLGLPALPEPLPSPCVDSHTHMDSVVGFSGLSVDDNLALAAEVGIDRIVQVGCNPDDSAWAEQCAARHRGVVAAVAIHPNDAARASREEFEAGLDVIESLAGAGCHVRAVGETGLDFFRTPKGQGYARQAESFAAHIEIAKRHDLTLAIHDRDAHVEILEILDHHGWPERVIFHCFSADDAFVERTLAHRCWYSFAGNITYKANTQMQAGLARAPRERILAETDAPYLTALPYRGKANASYLIAHTIRFIAEFKQWNLAECCQQLRANTFDAYGGQW